VLRRLDLRGVAPADLAGKLPRPVVGGDEPTEAVRAILDEVRRGGDRALRAATARFDGVTLGDFCVPAADLKRALDAVPPPVRAALEAARDNIADFGRAELSPPVTWRRDGLTVRTIRQPVDRAGCYVPGGRASYPSTVLMTAVPARVAGVGEVVVCVPPGADGLLPDVVLAAAALAEVDELYTVGGAQAVAAMAYGTETIRPVDVIVGPGNEYVAIAKRLVAGEGRVGVPSAFAGPSEVVVVADAATPPAAAAIDVIVQAEHGPDGLAWLVTWDEGVADAIVADVRRLVAAAPRRADIEATLGAAGWCALVDGPEQAMAVVNLVAPEHLELLTADAEELLASVRHAGAVFVGPLTPASLGDYVAGPSHVLPTAGSARFAGALTADDFTKSVHVVAADAQAFDRLAPHVAALAEAEGLAAHAESVRVDRGQQRREPPR
jgi:histidinol dehydrogenase